MINNSTTPFAAPSTIGAAYSPAQTHDGTKAGLPPLGKALEKEITGKADQELQSTILPPSEHKPFLQPSESTPIIKSNNVEATVGARVLRTPTDGR